MNRYKSTFETLIEDTLHEIYRMHPFLKSDTSHNKATPKDDLYNDYISGYMYIETDDRGNNHPHLVVHNSDGTEKVVLLNFINDERVAQKYNGKSVKVRGCLSANDDMFNVVAIREE